ncbi:MAG: 23S rRNA (cytidine(2498)-2'-O)-methyltransferase RlmM [Rhodocyclaceae bacterium]|nr:23S rRNA (cytidine(2498)-2'-O)-methyltransferase RlmM [Rhodocyclaceae bacterium]
MNIRDRHPDCDSVIALCRPGFEAECSGELVAALGTARTRSPKPARNTGLVRVGLLNLHAFDELDRGIRLSRLTFSRQLCFGLGEVAELPERDRVTPLLEAARAAATPFSAILPEAADSAAGRPLSGLARRLVAPLEREFTKANLLRPKRLALPRLHIVFAAPGTAWLGLSTADNGARWPMGIPRLRMPSGAPSRSTLKLAEAFLSLLDPDELDQRLRPGQRAVDLGAAPGGWTWQLAQRGLRVTAIDNGPMAGSVLATGMVEHVRADGFTWRPQHAVDWMVCDMVEQPGRIAALVAEWVASGRCRQSIFNLKLPMKKRLDEVLRCQEIIHQRMRRSSIGFELRLRQLYHDREEITGYLAQTR